MTAQTTAEKATSVKIERKLVNSSNIKAIGYDEPTKTLVVEFHGRKGKPGKIYAYNPVSPELHKEVISAPSIGNAFSLQIKINPDILFYEVTPG